MSHNTHHSQKRHKKLHRKRLKKLKLWHRRFGLISALLILFLVVTGVAINHRKDFNLAKTAVTQKWLLDYYDIAKPNNILTSRYKNNQIVIVDNLVWLNKQLILEADAPIITAAITDSYVIAVDADQLYLFDSSGKPVETQDITTGLPTPISRIAIEQDDTVWIESGNQLYHSDPELIDWVPAEPFHPIHWSQLTPSHAAMLELQVRSIHLSWQRVILDLHSGRFFGTFGKWLWDCIAILCLFIILSGSYVFFKQHRK
ncbi:MAG: PepSY domain-containing protein [Parashewanella sp.]